MTLPASVVCPLCVQWRCAETHEIECPLGDDMSCALEHGFEPYWPDGSVATITQDDYCDRCAQALAAYEAEVATDPEGIR